MSLPYSFKFSAVALFVICLAHSASATQYELFSGNCSDYTIIISRNASESEQYAAKELQSCLSKLCSVKLPIKYCGEGKKDYRIIVGYNDDLKSLIPDCIKPNSTDESFLYKSIGGDIVIIGGSDRGTMYGVFSFLERELGVRWYTSSCTVIPQQANYSFSSIEFSDAPVIPIRNIMSSELRDATFRVHCRLNEKIKTSPSIPNPQIGGHYALLAPHTMSFLLPIDEYYNSHPEYFALRNGKRKNISTQPCISNPDVLRICTSNLIDVMRTRPEFDIYQVSLNDNFQHCECKECQESIRRMGSYTDLVLAFVNSIASAVEIEFPEKKIEFLAYHEIQSPPLSVRPRSNVAIRVANSESCHIHGIEKCISEKAHCFYQELLKWRSLTNELNIWEYACNFSINYLPYPNFKGLQENIKTYHKLNVKGILEEGNHYTYNGEFQVLRDYVLPRLLWNPEADLDSLVNDFINGYYKSAAPYMRQYYDLITSKITDSVHLSEYTLYDNDFYSNELIRQALLLFEQAKIMADDDVILRRVEIEEFSVGLIYTFRNPKLAIIDGTFHQVHKVFEREGIELRWKDLKDKYDYIAQLAKWSKINPLTVLVKYLYSRNSPTKN